MGFGIWGLLVGEIGVSLSVVTTMTLGIVVDDTVHSSASTGGQDANLVTILLTQCGLPLARLAVHSSRTSLVLVTGFFIVSLSSFELNAGMGRLTALVIALALAADFFILPPLLMKVEEGRDKSAGSARDRGLIRHRNDVAPGRREPAIRVAVELSDHVRQDSDRPNSGHRGWKDSLVTSAPCGIILCTIHRNSGIHFVDYRQNLHTKFYFGELNLPLN